MRIKKSKIYTRSGDAGSTRLATGGTISKGHARIELLGSIDELNCLIGLLLSDKESHSTSAILQNIQPQLFQLGAEVAGAPSQTNWQETTLWLEQTIDQLDDHLPPLQAFILPGGGTASASCHLARAICRRTERHLIQLSQQEGKTNPNHVKYLNRLSDLLFVIARTLAKANRHKETEWKPGN